MKFDSDGYRFAMPVTALGIGAGTVAPLAGEHSAVLGALSILLLIAAACILLFFRDPERIPPPGESTVVSSADGVVVDASRVPAEDFEGGEALRIAVFMSVFNVHVNRVPLRGVVKRVIHRPGRKLSAFNERAADENEHGDTELETVFGPVRIRQIAGLIARRVVTRVREAQSVGRGERIGLIRFGSRVDVFLPATFNATVVRGDRVRAGETVIARPADDI